MVMKQFNLFLQRLRCEIQASTVHIHGTNCEQSTAQTGEFIALCLELINVLSTDQIPKFHSFLQWLDQSSSKNTGMIHRMCRLSKQKNYM